MAEAEGLAVQPSPKRNQEDLPSAHDLVCDAIDTALTSWAYKVDDDAKLTVEQLRLMFDDMLEAFVRLSGSNKKAKAHMKARKRFGLKKYGTPLQPFNGRDAQADLIDELGDALVYLRCKIYEEEAE